MFNLYIIKQQKERENMKQITIFISLLIISITSFVIGLIINDHLLMTLSWVSSVGCFLLVVLSSFTNFLDY